jgi:signal peptidase I
MTDPSHDSYPDPPDGESAELSAPGEQGEPDLTDRAPARSRLREWAESLAFTVIFVLVFTRFVAQATQVPTESMKPTIMVGDHFFLDKLAFPANYPEPVRPYLPARSVDRGDIIAFRAPDQGDIPFVKRVVGLPGDTLEIRDKVVWVDGRRLEEPYKIHVDRDLYTDDAWVPEQLHVRDNFGPVEIPEGHYFAMGDNRDNSNDSRYWGFVSSGDIIGKPLFVYWSYQSDPYIPGNRTLVDRLRLYSSVAVHFFSRTRWFRIGKMIE